MLRQRIYLPVLLLSFAMATSPARSEDRGAGGLSVIPADAMAFVCIPSLQALDVAYQQAVNDLGLQAFVPPPQDSIVGMLKQTLPLFADIDENGALALVVMPADSVEALPTRAALLIPAKNPKAMLDGLKAMSMAMSGQGADAEAAPTGDIIPLNLMGTPVHGGVNTSHVVLAMSPDVAKTIVSNQGGIAARLGKVDLAALDGLKIAVWADAERVIKLAKPQIDALTTMMAMAQAAEDPNGFTADSAQAVKNQIDVLVNGLKTLTFGVSLGQSGLGVRAAMTTVEGSEFAKQTKSIRTTSGPMFAGLPAGDYVMAFSSLFNPDATPNPFAQLETFVAMLEKEPEIDGSQIRPIVAVLESLFRLTTGVRGAVVGLGDGQDGVLGASVVFDTKNSEAWLAAFGKLADHIKRLPPEGAADAERVMQALAFEPGKETLSGTAVGQLRLDLAAAGIPDFAAEDEATLHKIVGTDGVTLRVAAVSGDTVALSFGGGASYMTQVIEQAKSKSSPLDDDPGIKKVAAHFPKERGGVFYLAVDHGAKLLYKIGEAVGDPFPFQLQPINAPLAIATTGGDGWSRFDLLVPTELVVAVKNAAMMAMMQPAGGAAPATQGSR